MSSKAGFALGALVLMVSATALSAQAITSDHLGALDANGDGAVDRTEFESFMQETFTKLDANGDGVLTVKEASAVIPADAFAAADANGDGKLSGSEFAAAVTEDFRKADLDGDGKLN